ncbi:MAG: hypothetical protein AAGD17_12795 [Bacteroidota bacterium]
MKKIFGLLLFTGLMLLKVSAFHVYAHQDDDCESIENCEICDIALENQTSDIDFFTPPALKINNKVLFEDVLVITTHSFESDSKVSLLLSRPPPNL